MTPATRSISNRNSFEPTCPVPAVAFLVHGEAHAEQFHSRPGDAEISAARDTCLVAAGRHTASRKSGLKLGRRAFCRLRPRSARLGAGLRLDAAAAAAADCRC